MSFAHWMATVSAGPVDQCVACANKHGANNSDGCHVCSRLAKPQHTAKCISCFDKASKVVAPADLADAVQSCSTYAVTSAANFTACENCILTTGTAANVFRNSYSNGFSLRKTLAILKFWPRTFEKH